MTKKFLLFAALVCTVLTGFTLTSCGGGDDEPKEVTKFTGKYTIIMSEDVLAVADVYVSYKGNNNENKMDKITSTIWSKKVSSKKFPAEMGIKYRFQPKEGAKLKERYEMSFKVTLSGKVVTGSTEKGNFTQSKTVFGGEFVPAANVDAELKAKSNQSYAFVVDKEGNASKTDKMGFSL